VQSCLICKEPLDEWMIAKDYAFHVNCGLWDSAHDDVQALKLKDDVQKIIRRTDDDSPRSRQKRIGPSEIGDSCARKIAYRLLETPEMNRVRDPWPAVVGTAIHQWLERAVNNYTLNRDTVSPKFGGVNWETEMRVAVNALVSGSTDVYDHFRQRVIDWKTAGTDKMRQVRSQGPPRQAIIQANLYGMGHENAKRQVKEVALVYLPRAGLLSGVHVWRDLYRREIAEEALARMEGIGNMLLQGVPAERVEAHPSDGCGYCPWFISQDVAMGVTANADGCPGR